MVQVLCKEGGMPLIMCVSDNGSSCLFVAAQEGHTAVVEVGAGGGRQREAGGRVISLPPSLSLSLSLSFTDLHTHTHTHAR